MLINPPDPPGAVESARQKRDQRLHQLVDQVRARKFPYEPRDPKPIDWGAYTDAQINELNDVMILIRDTVDAVPDQPALRHGGRGRAKEYDAKDLAKTLLVQQHFAISNRAAEGYARFLKEKLRLDRVPHYKAIERAYEDARVRHVLDEVFALTQLPEQDHIEGYTLDGSGLPRDVKGNWERDKSTKDAKKERFDGSVAMLTVPHMIVTAHVKRIVGFENESPTLKPLIETTVAHHGRLDGFVTADAAFLSRANCDLIEKAGATPRIFPKRNATLNPGGSKAWRAMLDHFLDHTQDFLHEYHPRSLSEAHWSRDKTRHGPLRRRIDRRRGLERHARFIEGNLARLAVLRRLGEVTIPWTHWGAA